MKRGAPETSLGASKSPLSGVSAESGKVPTTTQPKPLYGLALAAACLRELEKPSYLSPLEMEYLSIYRRILSTTSWDLLDETSSWN